MSRFQKKTKTLVFWQVKYNSLLDCRKIEKFNCVSHFFNVLLSTGISVRKLKLHKREKKQDHSDSKRNLLEMLGFMTKNSKEAFSETWFLSGNSVHFEIYDGGTSLDNSKLSAIKRHTGYIKSTVHGISLNYLCVMKCFYIRSMLCFQSPWFMIKKTEVWDRRQWETFTCNGIDLRSKH